MQFIPHLLIDSPWRTLIGLFNSPRAGMKQHVRKGVKRHDIHIKPKSYKLERLTVTINHTSVALPI